MSNGIPHRTWRDIFPLNVLGGAARRVTSDVFMPPSLQPPAMQSWRQPVTRADVDALRRETPPVNYPPAQPQQPQQAMAPQRQPEPVDIVRAAIEAQGGASQPRPDGITMRETPQGIESSVSGTVGSPTGEQIVRELLAMRSQWPDMQQPEPQRRFPKREAAANLVRSFLNGMAIAGDDGAQYATGMLGEQAKQREEQAAREDYARMQEQARLGEEQQRQYQNTLNLLQEMRMREQMAADEANRPRDWTAEIDGEQVQIPASAVPGVLPGLFREKIERSRPQFTEKLPWGQSVTLPDTPENRLKIAGMRGDWAQSQQTNARLSRPDSPRPVDLGEATQAWDRINSRAAEILEAGKDNPLVTPHTAQRDAVAEFLAMMAKVSQPGQPQRPLLAEQLLGMQ